MRTNNNPEKKAMKMTAEVRKTVSTTARRIAAIVKKGGPPPVPASHAKKSSTAPLAVPALAGVRSVVAPPVEAKKPLPGAAIAQTLEASAAKQTTKAVEVAVKREITGLHRMTPANVAPATERPGSISQVARALIREGKTDEQVMAALVKQCDLDPERTSYPSWYRSQLVRSGLVTAEFAEAHRHSGRSN